MKDEHVRDGPVKDAAQDMAEDMSGTAEDGSVKVFIVARATMNTFTLPPPPPTLSLGDT